MAYSSSGSWRRVGHSIELWCKARTQECVRCRECGSDVTLLASHCPSCGQANPAKVSLSAAVYLTIGFALVTLAISLSIVAWWRHRRSQSRQARRRFICFFV